MKKLFSSFCFCFSLLICFCQSQVKQVQLTSFQLQSSAVIPEDGSLLSTKEYHSRNYWFPVAVPCTVLSGLVANKVYPDPHIGMNNMMIPDASDAFNQQYHLEQYSFLPHEPNPWKKPYWYRSTFDVPAADRNKRFQLIFKGINYRADVWLNGKLQADSSQMAGMFAQYSLDVSGSIITGDTNVLAVKIYPLDEPGLPAHPQLNALGDFYENGGTTGDIGKNVTMLCSVGWDWIPEVHDRNIGIWQPVYLRTTGDVVIRSPHIITDLPDLPDTSIAKLSLDLALQNAGNKTVNGQLKLTIMPAGFTGNGIQIVENISLASHSQKQVDFNADHFKQLLFKNPHLWWPNNYGNPDLYKLRIQFISDGLISDDTSFLFGIRKVSSSATIIEGWVRRYFFVNGKRVHLDGGAWVPDMMLQRDSLRNDYELHLCRNANINLVRIWGGGLGETDDFYEAADRYGMMVWQDFWVTGDTHGEFKGSKDYPPRGDIFIRNIISTVMRIRNHPSLLVWTGGNEGHAREELYNAMRDNVAKLDGTRPFIPSSSGFAKLPTGWKGSWPDDQPSGVYSGGPYSWQDASQYYKLVNAKKDWLFKDETGLPSQPPYSSLSKIINNLVPDSSLPYPLNNTWGYHDACTGNGHYESYYKAMKDRFGEPVSMKDFCDKMQLLNADGYRGIFEAAGHKLDQTGGVMLWKLNAALPSVVWQVYDWYLEPNAGYYFMKRACEPLHIQLNLDDSTVAVVNRTYYTARNLTATIDVLDMDGKNVFHREMKANTDTASATEILGLAPALQKSPGISFVVLHLADPSGKPLSDNVYWMEPSHNFRSLPQMKPAVLKITGSSVVRKGNENIYTFKIKNVSDQLAFFINPQITVGNEEVLPTYWSDNYFSLMPAHEMAVTATCPLVKLTGKPTLTISGWNVALQQMGLTEK